MICFEASHRSGNSTHTHNSPTLSDEAVVFVPALAFAFAFAFAFADHREAIGRTAGASRSIPGPGA
jgi:hypothetical protein